jgi:tripartite-type tricarboxylate transporter receptor subunit TctC
MKRLFVAAAAALIAGTIAGPAPAQTGRTTPMKIIAGFPPGGNVDLLARVFGERLGEAMGGRPVIVLNKPGAGGQVAAELLKASPPDGDTLLLTPDASLIVRALVLTTPPYDPIADFAPVAETGAQDYAFALSMKIPPKSLREFGDWAKANPDGANFGSAGEGGVTHFLGLLIGDALGVKLRPVPYNGSGPAVNALAAGEIASTLQPLGTLVNQASAGTIRVVAVSGRARSPAFPNAPSVAELGFNNLVATSWFGIFAPAKTPPDIVAKYNIFTDAMKTPRVKETMNNLLLDINDMSPAQFSELVKHDLEYWRPIIKASGFKIDVK